MSLLDRIRTHAETAPQHLAIAWKGGGLTYAGLAAEVARVADMLVRLRLRTFALVADNSVAWAIIDLAALEAGVCIVPVPQFFSKTQARHAVSMAQVQAVITDDPTRTLSWLGEVVEPQAQKPMSIAGHHLTLISATGDGTAVPQGVQKLTYTSGTTGTPKGVMLSWSHVRPVVESLVDSAAVEIHDRHLALTPLAVLLENIAGLYAPLWSGATTTLLPLEQVGLGGGSMLDVDIMGEALTAQRASTAILTPHSLLSLVKWIEAGNPSPDALRLVAVGGATVSRRLLERAQNLGLPVYEGYGLSECSSVVCLNTPSQHRTGSVGKPLSHSQIQISADGDVQVVEPGFAGYLGEPAPVAKFWSTGDLGRLDDDGFLYLLGRRRDVIITTTGRNIAPEWVECELVVESAIAQAVVFGEAQPWLTALIVPTLHATPSDIASAVERVNRELPDYARVLRWTTAWEPFTPTNGCVTGTGRIRREAVYQRYAEELQSLYCEEKAS